MQAAHRPLALIVVGLMLLVLSLFLPSLLGGRRAWSDAQAQAYTQAAAEYHAAKLGAHPHIAGDHESEGHAGSTAVSVEQAERRFEEERRRLESALDRGRTWAFTLRVLGVLSLVAGVGWHWKGRA